MNKGPRIHGIVSNWKQIYKIVGRVPANKYILVYMNMGISSMSNVLFYAYQEMMTGYLLCAK